MVDIAKSLSLKPQNKEKITFQLVIIKKQLHQKDVANQRRISLLKNINNRQTYHRINQSQSRRDQFQAISI